MSSYLLYALAGVVLCGVGFAGFILIPHLLRKLLAFNVAGSGTFLVLIGLAQHRGGVESGVDPVPQALVLTGIVVAVSATALALVLIRRYFHLTGQTTLDPAGQAGNGTKAQGSGEGRQS